MELLIHSCFLSDIVVLILVYFAQQVPAFPSGAPLSACSHLLPVHVDGEQQTTPSPYVLIMNDTTYGKYPIKLTVSAIGTGARDFMAFMLQARSEFGDPAGYFSDVPPASKTMTCYEKDDTLTHTAAYIRSIMEVVWHPPSKNIGKILIKGSVALSKIKFWPVESSTLVGTGPLERSGAAGQAQQPGNNGTNTNAANSGITTNSRNSSAGLLTKKHSSCLLILMYVIIKVLYT